MYFAGGKKDGNVNPPPGSGTEWSGNGWRDFGGGRKVDSLELEAVELGAGEDDSCSEFGELGALLVRRCIGTSCYLRLLNLR